MGTKIGFVETIVLIVVIVLVALIALGRSGSLGTLVLNGLLGVVLLFLTNLFLEEDIPINLLTILICAVGGVIGWLIILILHLLGIAFTITVQ